MSQLYADIIIDIVHQDVDKVFQYIIPEHLEGQIKIGMPVEVPFGKGNKSIIGYIIHLSDRPQIDISRMKAIKNLVYDKTGIETELIQLAIWMSNQYGSTTISALKTVLPIQQKIKHKEKKYIHLDLTEEACGKLLQVVRQKKYVAMERLLSTLLEHSVLSLDFVKKNLKVSMNTIDKLVSEQAIRLSSEEVYRKPYNFYQKEHNLIEPNPQQRRVIESIVEDYKANQVKTYLLHGVTGSGKTEVYMRIIEQVLRAGRQAIVLIPEIALTFQTLKRFYERFGSRVGVLHSKLSQGERYDQYIQAKNGSIDIVVGPRSALFTPFSKLGLIIIDEEHETTYKSEVNPKYHAKEVAIKRAELAGASVILGSATPSVESYYEAKKGKFKLLELNERVDHRPLPLVEIVDMREELAQGNKSILSYKLRLAIEERLLRKEQIILFINRRGFARFVSCRSCGFVSQCEHCDVAYTYHHTGELICHYCGKTVGMPSQCPKCHSKYIKQFGTGTQKVEAYIKSEFNNARILRMDMDTTSKKNSYEEILTKFANHEADILIGTQMVAKGHDFPNVSLVGVLAADLSLYMNDFRSSERTFSLLTQVAGRAGRGEIKGDVVIQTYSPEHFSIQFAKEQNYKDFFKEEIQYREMMNYPPFSNILSVLMMSKIEEELMQLSFELKKDIDMQLDSLTYDSIGPTSASISKISDIYRRVFFIKAKDYQAIIKARDKIDRILEDNVRYKNMRVSYDINPLHI